MEEEKKKHDFGKGFLVGGLVGLGVGVAGTCVAAALMSDDEPEIEDQEDEQTEEVEETADTIKEETVTEEDFEEDSTTSYSNSFYQQNRNLKR